jgi:toxin ParE1/3/4
VARLRFCATANAQLAALSKYIADDSPTRALAFVSRLRERCAMLKTWPWLGRQRPEFGPGIRSFTVGSIVVFYHVSADGRLVEILRIIDGRRDLGTAFFSPLVLAVA